MTQLSNSDDCINVFDTWLDFKGFSIHTQVSTYPLEKVWNVSRTDFCGQVPSSIHLSGCLHGPQVEEEDVSRHR